MTSQSRSINFSVLSAILLCATIVSTVLFSGVIGGNTFNYYVTAVFVAFATAAALLEKKQLHFSPEILVLTLWLCYALLPSMGAQDIDGAYVHARQMLQIVIIAFLSINVMMWYGRTEIFVLVYFMSALLAYVASLAGFGFGVIDASVLQEQNSATRIVGTHSNANQFGTLCVQAQLAALFFGAQAKTLYARLVAGFAIAVLGVAIINTGSRTAFLGMIFMFLSLVWIFRVWRIRYLARSILLIAVIGVVGTSTYLVLDEDSSIKTRMHTFLENEFLMNRYEGLFRLVINLNDPDEFSAELSSSDQYRAELINLAWNAAVDEPLGLGLDNFKILSNGRYSHSNYFELLATTGFPGLAIYMAIYFFMLRRVFVFARRREITPVVRVFAISVLALMIMDISTVSYFRKQFWLFLALAISSIELCRRTNSIQTATNRQSQTFAYSVR